MDWITFLQLGLLVFAFFVLLDTAVSSIIKSYFQFKLHYEREVRK